MTLRGAYDFIAIIEGSDFETIAGMKMLMGAITKHNPKVMLLNI